MIDTAKYEGHLIDEAVKDYTSVWCWQNWMLKHSETIGQRNATAALLNDAPKLLAEVKRLRRKIALLDIIEDRDGALDIEILNAKGIFKEHELKGIYPEEMLLDYDYWR